MTKELLCWEKLARDLIAPRLRPWLGLLLQGAARRARPWKCQGQRLTCKQAALRAHTEGQVTVGKLSADQWLLACSEPQLCWN